MGRRPWLLPLVRLLERSLPQPQRANVPRMVYLLVLVVALYGIWKLAKYLYG